MKFSCDRCGKRYATADTPVPGRVYKLKCRACGHVIVLKGPPAGAPAAGAPPRRAPPPVAAPPPRPAPTPVPTVTAVEIAPEPPPAPEVAYEPAAAPVPPEEPPPPAPFEARAATPVPVAPAPAPDAEPADAGYVELFEEGSLGDGTGLPLARGPRSGPPPSGDDGSGELPAPSVEPAAPPAPALPTPRVPDLPRPPTEQRGAPLKLIGLGVLVMLAIVAVAVWRGGGRTAPARPAGPAGAPAAKVPEASPVPAPAPPPPATEPAPGDAPAPALGSALGPAATPTQPAPAPERAEPARPAAEAPRPSRAPAPPAAPAAAAGQPSGTLTPERIQEVIAASRPRFDACLADARPGRGLVLDGRTVNLRVAITPAGAATYPTFDDVTIGSTALGACLKGAARQMAFPRFEGEPVRIEVPITLPRR